MSQTHQEVSTRELVSRIQSNSQHRLLDIRPVEAYNGWKLRGEPRGGHIESAVAFPIKWTHYKNWVDVLKSKGILADMPVTLYAYDEDSSKAMADRLGEMGYRDISIYNHFTDEWSPDRGLPMDRLDRYQQLVYPGWLKTLLDGEKPETFEGGDFAVCHSHYGYRKDYDDGHIPGAIHLDTMELESPETWNRRSPEELKKALLKRGISQDTTVIVYGRFSHPDNRDDYPGQNAGHLGAMRSAAILLYAGVRDVRILNGGLNQWQEAGFPVSTEEKKPEPKSEFGAQIPARPEVFIDMPKAKELLKADDGELVSIRSWEEFIGNVSGYNYIGKTGRIPGAVFGNCGSDAYHMENYRNPDHTMRSFHETAAGWTENDIVPKKHIAFYCGTGWRASEAFWNAYLMGWPKVSIYDGGWFEWSNDPDNPVETGEPE
jgi:thiosulfate/3-mercaptopyruvate sulfurtransferase